MICGKIFRSFICRFNIGLICVLSFISTSVANSSTLPTPRVKPEAPNISRLLSKKDAANLRQGLRAADNSDWSSVNLHYRRIDDMTARRILLWRRAYGDPKISFNNLSKVIHEQPNWPKMIAIRAKAEKLLFDQGLKPNATIQWFLGERPVSGEGRAAMARAYYALGQDQIGYDWLKLAWRESKLTRDVQRQIYKNFKDSLSRDDHAARADYLIWLGRRHFPKANGLLSLMDKRDAAVMEARMRIAANRRGMGKAINAVHKSKLNDTGLLFERARWRRIHRSEQYAMPTFLKITVPPVSEAGKKRLWREKKRMIYWALKNKRYQDAYELSRHHGFKRGVQFAEAEFLGGWIALTFLEHPQDAKRHFESLAQGVSRPVSLARAKYWLGRAKEDLSDSSANADFIEASRYPNTFYGQLSLEHLSFNGSTLSLPLEVKSKDFAPGIENNELIRALRMIGETQNERAFNTFSFHLDDILSNEYEISQLAQLAKQYGFMKPSVRAAKQAARFGTMLTESGYPMPEIILNLHENYDIPFVLAIARQESEFNTRARSHARAYGLMQMINATARSTARGARIPYRKSWLVSDPEYAANLGARHLQDLLDKYDGSYILAAVAYNAGPHRVNQWIKTYGDPRTGQIDPIDWIESIPFSETRNYVQRVMENLQVYRARLINNQAKLRLVHDITRGAYR